jgi:hypothetical protein
MRYLTRFSLVLLIALLWHPRASAQYSQGSLPSGSYVQTCRNIRTVGNTLEAVCQTGNGDWTWSSLQKVDECTSGVQNLYGTLGCTKSVYAGQITTTYYYPPGHKRGYAQSGLPAGSYLDTCADAYISGTTLVANCQKSNGSWRRSSLHYFNECSSSVWNNNGQLGCRRE